MVVLVLRGGGLFSDSSITTDADVAAVVPHGVTRALSSSGSLVHSPSALASQGFLVPYGGRSCPPGPSVAGVPGDCSLVFRCSTSGSPSVSASAYGHFSFGLGAHLLDLMAVGV